MKWKIIIIVSIFIVTLVFLLKYDILFSSEKEYSEYYCIVNGEKIKREEFYDLYSRRNLYEANHCNCYPKEGKNKFAVIMKKNSEFYSPELKDELDDYFEAINLDLGIENVGIVFQDFSEKDSSIKETIHNLYLNKDVGYILLIGNDLIHDSFGNTSDTSELAFLPYQYPHRYQIPLGEAECPSVALSALVSPNYQDFNRKKEFILNQLDNYIQFHKDPKNYLSNFSRSCLRIVNLDVSGEYTSFDPSSPDTTHDLTYYWDLPKRDILSSNPNLKSEIREERPMILEIMAHGWARILAWQKRKITNEIKNVTIEKYGTTDEWLEFTEDFIPSVLIINQGCGGMIIDDYNTTRYNGSQAKFCCYPQAFLKSGALAYISGSRARVYDFTGSDFFGQALRKTPLGGEYFGDLFAHL